MLSNFSLLQNRKKLTVTVGQISNCIIQLFMMSFFLIFFSKGSFVSIDLVFFKLTMSLVPNCNYFYRATNNILVKSSNNKVLVFATGKTNDGNLLFLV